MSALDVKKVANQLKDNTFSNDEEVGTQEVMDAIEGLDIDEKFKVKKFASYVWVMLTYNRSSL